MFVVTAAGPGLADPPAEHRLATPTAPAARPPSPRTTLTPGQPDTCPGGGCTPPQAAQPPHGWHQSLGTRGQSQTGL